MVKLMENIPQYFSKLLISMATLHISKENYWAIQHASLIQEHLWGQMVSFTLDLQLFSTDWDLGCNKVYGADDTANDWETAGNDHTGAYTFDAGFLQSEPPCQTLNHHDANLSQKWLLNILTKKKNIWKQALYNTTKLTKDVKMQDGKLQWWQLGGKEINPGIEVAAICAQCCYDQYKSPGSSFRYIFIFWVTLLLYKKSWELWSNKS